MGLRKDIIQRSMEKMAAISDYMPDNMDQVVDALKMTGNDIVGGLDSAGSYLMDKAPIFDASAALSSLYDSPASDSDLRMMDVLMTPPPKSGVMSRRGRTPDLALSGKTPDFGKNLSDLGSIMGKVRAAIADRESLPVQAGEFLGERADVLDRNLGIIGDHAQKGYNKLDELKVRGSEAYQEKKRQVGDLLNRVMNDVSSGAEDTRDNFLIPLKDSIGKKVNDAINSIPSMDQMRENLVRYNNKQNNRAYE